MQIGNTSKSIRLRDPLGSLWVSWGPDTAAQVTGQLCRPPNSTRPAALEVATDPAGRRALLETMLSEWETEAPAALLSQPRESYGVRKGIKWQPYTFYYIDLRPYNLRFD